VIKGDMGIDKERRVRRVGYRKKDQKRAMENR
jgi:hypothetical protein